MGSKECCCYSCFRQKICVGCNWFSDTCSKDKSKCELLAQRKRLFGIFKGDDEDDKSKSE